MGILMQSVVIILKFFASPGTNAIWPFYTLVGTVGWATYVTAQSLVLYSRLHLVMQNQRIQRYVFWMILSTIFTFVIPVWVVSWPAYNTLDYEMSSTWSPRFAIADRYEQLGYLITESVISGLYIWSLVRLLKLKSNVRRRRVMTDLIIVNILVIAFDILSVLFTYTNQLGISQPVQTFSYILKLRLEFVVLNQLMDVAARGMRREAFRGNHYYLTAKRENVPSNDDGSSQEAKNPCLDLAIKKDSSEGPTQATLPLSIPLASDTIYPPKSTYQMRPINGSVLDVQISGPEFEPGSNSFHPAGTADRKGFSTAKLGASFELPQASGNFEQHSSGGSKPSKLLAFQQHDRLHRKNSGDNEEEDEEKEEEDFDLYMWERGKTVVLEVPWFRSKVEA